MVGISADRYIRGIDRSEGAESFARLHYYAVLEAVAHSEGKTPELQEHGCIEEFSYTCYDVVRRTALDPSDGGRADA